VDKPGMIRTPMGTQNRSKWPQCMGRFVWYHSVTVTTSKYSLFIPFLRTCFERFVVFRYQA
jgi:hypothetical protein